MPAMAHQGIIAMSFKYCQSPRHADSIVRHAAWAFWGAATLLWAVLPVWAKAASAEDFRTPEYHAMGGLDMIHAADAYALGYTGKGLFLGIFDTPVNFMHREFTDKTGSGFLWHGDASAIDWATDTHGSHVAGIMAAARNGLGMHGLAFDADILSANLFAESLWIPSDTVFESLQRLGADPRVRVINHSWVALQDTLDVIEWDDLMMQNLPQASGGRGEIIRILRQQMLQQDVVQVFSAGNQGYSAASSLPSMFIREEADIALRVMNVASVDAQFFDTGANTATSPAVVSVFSNLAKYAEESSLSAPGSNILAPDAAIEDGYISHDGTSMAAPFVTAAVGLTSQAFPFLSGKQLVDVVLGSANDTFALPRFTVTVQEEFDASSGLYVSRINVYYFGSKPATEAEIEADLRHYYQTNINVMEFYRLTEDGFLAEARAVYGNVPREIVFGQGILDVGAAVRGPKVLNARRLGAESLSTVYAPSGEALYSVDTKGHSAEWSNDISEKRAGLLSVDSTEADLKAVYDFYMQAAAVTGNGEEQKYIDWYNDKALASGLVGLSVGLKKEGAGTLMLSGNNDYQGTTVIAGGALSVSKRQDGTGGELLRSNVQVETAGTLKGNGIIHQSVTNHGKVAPGNSIGTLTVGRYEQGADGILEMEFNAASEHDVLAVTGDALLAGTLNLRPEADYYHAPQTLPLSSLMTVGGTQAGAFDAAAVALSSPTLTMSLMQSGNSYTVTPHRAADAYSRHAGNDSAAAAGRGLASAVNVRGDMRNLYAALDFSARNGMDVRKGLSQLAPDAYGNAALASLGLHRMLTGQFESGMFAQTANRGGEWRVVVEPYAGHADQSAGSMSGYRATNSGLASRVERYAADGLGIGGHVIFNYQSMTGKTNGKSHGEGLYLGGHALYAPDGWNGWHVFGIGRAGVENWRMTREVAFNGYYRANKEDWTGFSGAFRAGGGHMADFGMVKAGPFAALDYAFSRRPSLKENGGMGSRLDVEASTVHSLRSSLGVRVGTGEASGWNGHASIAWNHELLAKAGMIRASFMDADNAGFSSAARMPGRDSLGLGVGMSLRTGRGFSVLLNAGSELFCGGGSTVSGNLAVEWPW